MPQSASGSLPGAPRHHDVEIFHHGAEALLHIDDQEKRIGRIEKLGVSLYHHIQTIMLLMSRTAVSALSICSIVL